MYLTVALILFFVIYVYVYNKSFKSLQMLQQNLYNENNRYVKWIFKNIKETFFNISIYSVLFAFLLLFNMREAYYVYFSIVIVTIFIVAMVLDVDKRKYDQNKKPLVFTKRVKRLVCTIVILYLIPFFLFTFGLTNIGISILIISIMASLNYFVIYLANVLNHPIERSIYHHFERCAKNKLKSMPSLKIVGITGSYGKTSCKNILNDILSIKYNTYATEKSINTFNGLMIAINNKLSKFDDIFIAEMGAYVKGEINGLCKLVNPKYGIITRIGTAHLETFGSEENIRDGKMELIEYLPKDGVGVLNRDDEKQKKYKFKKQDHCKILWIGIDSDDVDVKALNIKCDYNGTNFDVLFKNDKKKYHFETKLLGKHNVYNILASLALGVEFGIKKQDLVKAVRKVKPVEHRLTINKISSFYMIDDAYNSNPTGAKGALEVLSYMPGDKVVVTPGMIELGKKEEYYNKEFGRQIKTVAGANKVILVGKNRTKPIYNGLVQEGFNKKDIYVINDVKEAYKLLETFKKKKDLYALFENDLPDTYTE